MSKFVPDAVFSFYFGYISASSNMVAVCAGSPLTYSDCTSNIATGGCMLALQPMTTGCFAVGDGSPNGRTITMTAKTAASIVNSGSALAVALVNTTAGSVTYITTCTSQYLVSGGTVDIPSWTVNVADPT